MPTYEYACGACGHHWEAFQSIKDSPLTKCPECKKSKAQRQISAGTGFILKGSGWYSDLYSSGKGASKAKGGSEGGSSSGTSEGGSSSSGGDVSASTPTGGGEKTSTDKGADKGADKKDKKDKSSTAAA